MLLLWTLVACSSYAPTDEALDALMSDDLVTVTERDDFIQFEPAELMYETAVVFYPGGLVMHEAYAPPLHLLAEAGVRTVLVPMPSDLAVFAPGKADKVLDELGGDAWVVAGHSLGASMAASYAEAGREEIVGLNMWAGYPPKSKDLSQTDLSVWSITASLDEVLDAEKFEESKALLPARTVFVDIEGGNHAGFGDYGAQDGDGEATLPVGVQHALTVAAMLEQLDDLEPIE
jgi:pimeloyl-ACP methyl ester carboxylesterase